MTALGYVYREYVRFDASGWMHPRCCAVEPCAVVMIASSINAIPHPSPA